MGFQLDGPRARVRFQPDFASSAIESGEGRVFYTALGHRDDIWSNDAVFRAHIKGGIRWALGLE